MQELCLSTTSLDRSLWAGGRQVPLDWPVLWNSVRSLMKALARGLPANEYPAQVAGILAAGLTPVRANESLANLLLGNGRLRLCCDAEAAALPLELLPIGEGGWLDLKQPFYRVLTQPESSFLFEVQRTPNRRSVALLYQNDSPEVRKMVREGEDCIYALLESLGLRAKCFTAGELFCGQTTPDLEVLLNIFRNHACVIFIGNGAHAQLSRSTGWVIDAQRGLVLTCKNISDAFLLSRSAQSRERHTVCDLVFSNSCCSGAVAPLPDEALPCGENQRADTNTKTFPELFQALGVRHYVGTLTEVLVRPDITLSLLRTFFTRWAAAPEGVVEHLFAAKKAVHEHLRAPHVQTALYQVFEDSRDYVPYPEEIDRVLKAAEPETPMHTLLTAPVAQQSKAPVLELAFEFSPMLAARGSLVGLVQPADVLLAAGRRWVMGEPLANDVCGRWYRARSNTGSCLIQVLADEPRKTLPRDLEAVMLRVIEQISALNLSSWHLCPTGFAWGDLCREGEALPLAGGVPVLFYAREDVDEQWSALVEEPLGRSQLPLAEFLHRVLDWGHDAGLRLGELHDKGLAHGNVFPGSFMVRRGNDAGLNGTLVLKDTWLALALGRRIVPRRYAAPDAWQGKATSAMDVHGLGLVLYELACGAEAYGEASAISGLPEPMSKVLGQAAPEVEGLERCVRDCLVPDERLRPTSRVLRKRLFICWTMGGHYLSDFAGLVHQIVEADRRLLVVGNAVEPGEVWRSLLTLASGPQPVLPMGSSKEGVHYELYVIREGRGLSRWHRGMGAEEVYVTWEDAAALQRLTGLALDDDQVLACNAERLFQELALLPQPRHTIVLVEGASWWAKHLGLRGARVLRDTVGGGGPVVVIADAIAELYSELLRESARVWFPSPSRAVIYEEVMQFCSARHLRMDVDEAVSLALRFAQARSSLKEARLCLRLCWLAHGVVDMRAGGMLDGQHARRLRQPGLQVTPVAQLPPADDYFLPPPVVEPVAAWVAGARVRASSDHAPPVPSILGVFGEPGTGRSALVRHVAARLGWQLARLHPSRCADRELGSAERNLRHALLALGSAGPAVVLIEADEEWPASLFLDRGPALRLLPILVDWLKNLPPHLVAMVVASPGSRLPRELAGVVPVWLPPLPSCSGPVLTGVLGRLFARHLLPELARDAAFLDRMSAALATSQRRAWLPEAGLIGSLQPAIHTRSIGPAAEVSAWFEDTLRVHAAQGSPVREPSFWISRFDLSTPPTNVP